MRHQIVNPAEEATDLQVARSAMEEQLDAVGQGAADAAELQHLPPRRGWVIVVVDDVSNWSDYPVAPDIKTLLESYDKGGPVAVPYDDILARLLLVLHGDVADVFDTTGRLAGQDVSITRVSEEHAQRLLIPS